ncbi:hypothetical protein [Streptomyces sp. DSM 41534]
MDPNRLPADWAWKVTRPSGHGFEDNLVDYAAALRDRRSILLEESPGVALRRRKQPWHRAAPYASGATYPPFANDIPFGLWIFSLTPDDEERSGRTWGQTIWFRVPAWWALGPQGRTAAALLTRLEKLTREKPSPCAAPTTTHGRPTAKTQPGTRHKTSPRTPTRPH